MKLLGHARAMLHSHEGAELAHLVELDIRAEFESHLAMLEEQLVARGASAEEARREAGKRFGNVDAVFQDCRRIRLREWTMNQRVNSFLLVLLAIAIGYISLVANSSRTETQQAVFALQDQLADIGAFLREQERNRTAGRMGTGTTPERRHPVGARAASGANERTEAETKYDSSPPPSPESFLQKLNTAWPLSNARDIANRLASLAAEDAVRILTEIYSRIDNAEVRQIVIGPLVKAHPQHALAFLYLGAKDTSIDVRNKALAQLSNYAFLDFGEHPEAFDDWYATYGSRPAGDALSKCLAEHITKLRGLEGEELASAFDRLTGLPRKLVDSLGIDTPMQMRNAGILEVLDRLVRSRDSDVRQKAWDVAARGVADEEFLRRHAAPLLADRENLPRRVVNSIYRAVAAQKTPWASEVLRDAMVKTPARTDWSFFHVAMALAKNGDPAAIPTMIGMIVADDTPTTIYGIGWFGLNKLTGVPYDENHHGKWWLHWWKNNQHRLPESVRGQRIPTIQLVR